MGIFTVPDFANIFLSIAHTILLNFAFEGVSGMLKGLNVYRIPKGSDDSSSPEQASASGTHLTRRQRKSALSDNLDGADQIVFKPLDDEEVKEVIHELDFYREFDYLVFAAQLAFSSAVFGELLEFPFGLGRTNLPALMLIMAVATAIAVLCKVEFLSVLTPTRERAYMCIIFIFSVFPALLLLLAIPDTIIDWREAEAARALQKSISELLQSRLSESSKLLVPGAISDLWFQITLTLFAAGSASLLFTSAARTTRSFSLALRPPHWGKAYICTKLHTTVLLLLDAVVLPLCLLLLWVKPVSLGLWGLTEREVELGKAVGMITYGALHFLLFRPYMQLFLHHALVAWHNLKHNSNIRDGQKLGKLLRLRVQVINALMCKAAIQTLVPAILFGSFGVMLMVNWLMEYQASLGKLNLLGMKFLPRECWAMFANFGAFWVTGTWFGFMVMSYVLLRTGILTALT